MNRTEISVQELIGELATGAERVSGDKPLAITNNGVVLYYIATGAQLSQGSAGDSGGGGYTGLTLGEAATLAGCSKQTIWRRVKKGDITDRRKANGDYNLNPDEVRAVFSDKEKDNDTCT